MSIHPCQLRSLIDETLQTILPNYYSLRIRELLMITAAQESFCGRYLQQVSCGIALGIFQMEPSTYEDLFDNYLRYHQDILDNLGSHFKVNKDNFRVNMMGNLVYQIVLARLHYLRFPEELPDCADIVAMAYYYKKYWNTVKGKASIGEILSNYDKYAF